QPPLGPSLLIVHAPKSHRSGWITAARHDCQWPLGVLHRRRPNHAFEIQNDVRHSSRCRCTELDRRDWFAQGIPWLRSDSKVTHRSVLPAKTPGAEELRSA